MQIPKYRQCSISFNLESIRISPKRFFDNITTEKYFPCVMLQNGEILGLFDNDLQYIKKSLWFNNQNLKTIAKQKKGLFFGTNSFNAQLFCKALESLAKNNLPLMYKYNSKSLDLFQEEVSAYTSQIQIIKTDDYHSIQGNIESDPNIALELFLAPKFAQSNFKITKRILTKEMNRRQFPQLNNVLEDLSIPLFHFERLYISNSQKHKGHIALKYETEDTHQIPIEDMLRQFRFIMQDINDYYKTNNIEFNWLHNPQNIN